MDSTEFLNRVEELKRESEYKMDESWRGFRDEESEFWKLIQDKLNGLVTEFDRMANKGV
jgi:hypothetical protein